MLLVTLYLTSVCHALNPTERCTGKEMNHTAELNCITISCNKWLRLWHEWWSWQNAEILWRVTDLNISHNVVCTLLTHRHSKKTHYYCIQIKKSIHMRFPWSTLTVYSSCSVPLFPGYHCNPGGEMSRLRDECPGSGFSLFVNGDNMNNSGVPLPIATTLLCDTFSLSLLAPLHWVTQLDGNLQVWIFYYANCWDCTSMNL